MNISNIAWTHGTWNPWIGCHEVSPECAGCYARAFREGKGHCFNTLTLTSTWQNPYKLNALAGQRGHCAFMFASSLTDWFHKDADTWRGDAWDIVRDCRNIVWLVLTKRTERIPDHLPADWTENFPASGSERPSAITLRSRALIGCGVFLVPSDSSASSPCWKTSVTDLTSRESAGCSSAG